MEPPMIYDPTPAEAREHLRRWASGRRRYAATLGPEPWQAIAVEKALGALERDEEENRGMVVADLDAWETTVQPDLEEHAPGVAVGHGS